jgi:valyl-tRNA synthetase
MSQPKFELDKAYDPKKFEADIYAKWQESGAFKPDLKAPKDPFTIIMPPPNANGHIHMGTAMFTIEDIMTRYRRMAGHKTLWLPGTDHAGIETQVVYERELEKQGKSRFDFTREQFYSDVLAWTRANQSTIIGELKSMGFSADWSRLQFTLDHDIIHVVNDTFKRLHDAGHLYRANRIVNWCPHCRSAFADIEVKYREQMDPLYYIKYGPFVLATVRPETKFGDTAIAVNPKDKRYKQYVGQTIEAEDLNGPIKLKVIADNFVNPEFGTGVVKVTPAHDPNDWEMGLRHNLEVKQAIGTDGRLTELTGRYAGMPVAEARQQVAHDLEERGLMDHVDMNYTHSVGYHARCDTLIEPLVLEQWWLNVQELKKPAIKAFAAGEIQIVPARFKKVCMDWLENLRDWNVSRQNWWGIRIPVYYNAGSTMSKKPYIIATNEAEAITEFGEGHYEAETDNFDTWFSSGQWPYATTMTTGDYDQGFYPTSVMETGRDILFQWVTRMVMLGIFRTGKVPFKTVYLHGLITDEHGKKMSKSKGNVINPLVMTEKYGTDALRLALTIGITPGNDGALSERKIEGYRNFCNKLWNVARFTLSTLPEGYSPSHPEPKTPADAWILARTNDTVREVTNSIEDYRFSEAGQMVYSLLWDDFADWYVEASKVEQNPNILYHTLAVILKLLHPIAPFVTEAIWQALPATNGQLITAQWPEAVKAPAELTRQSAKFDQLKTVVQAARTVAAEEQLSKYTILTTDAELSDAAALITRLAKAGELKRAEQGSGLYLGTATPAWIQATTAQIEARKHRLKQQHSEKQAYLKALETRLANVSYLKSAPPSVVQDTRDRHEETAKLLTKLNEQLAALK